MATKYVNLPLFDMPYYEYRTTLEDKTFKVSFMWNERTKKWFFSLYQEDGVPLVQNVGLMPRYPICFDYVLPDLTGAFILDYISTQTEGVYEKAGINLKDYFRLSYFFEDDE